MRSGRCVRAGRRVGFPRHRSRKRTKPSFRLRNRTRPGETQDIRVVDHHHVKVPGLGVVKRHGSNCQLRRMVNAGRAHVLSATIRFERRRWWLTVSGLAAPFHPARTSRKGRHGRPTGMDLGIRSLAVVANDQNQSLKKWEGVNALEGSLRALRRANRRLARTKPGSAGRRRAARRLGRLHARVADLRRNDLHQLTSWAATHLAEVTVEDLNVAGMLANRRLARRLSDASFGELRRQLTYKARWYGTVVHEADRWYPSSKTCSACGHLHHGLTLADATWACPECRVVHDRDHNAAVNLARWSRAHAPPDTVAA